MYTTTVILNERPAKPGTQCLTNPPTPTPHHMNHASMAALIDWVEFHHMCLGTPRASTPYFSVEHTDGSPMSVEERGQLMKVASVEAYRERQRRNNPYDPVGSIV